MAKREYILRDEALSHPFANGKYDHKNADVNFILGHESYEEWLETLSAFTEQDIVKSVLEKIRAEIIAESFPEDEENSFCKIIYLKDVLDIIDKYREESEVGDGNDD